MLILLVTYSGTEN